MPKPSNQSNGDEETVRRRTRHLVYRSLFWLGILMMAVGLTGELLGWFDAVGVVASFAGMAASVLALLQDQSEQLRQGQHRTHANQEGMLRNQEGMLENQEGMLQHQESMLRNQQGMLDNQGRMLDNQETMVEQLERIGDILDERLPSH